MTPGSRLNDEIERCCASYKICVLPRSRAKLPVSIWSMPELAYHVGVMWRCNTGALKAGNRFIRFGTPGIPDFEGWFFDGIEPGMQGGRRFSIEGKAGKDKATPDQAEYALLAYRTNVYHGFVTSYESCVQLLESWGLRRPL